MDIKVGFNALLELGLNFGAIDLGRSGRSWCSGLDGPRDRAWSCQSYGNEAEKCEGLHVCDSGVM